MLCVFAACGLQESPTDQTSRGIAPELLRDIDPSLAPTGGRLAVSEAPPELPAEGLAEPPRPPADGRHALLIGIDNARGAPQLRGAVNDARTTHEALLAYGFPRDQVRTLADGQAGRDDILSAIRELAAAVPDDGTAVFAFAGHTRVIRGQNHIVAADGRTISARDLAAALDAVRSPMWVLLPTCYAAGFSLPGIVGPGRVALFASAADRPSYEASWYGRSFLVQYVVAEAMLNGRASTSVEQAFAYAEEAISARYPGRVPLMDDGFDGEFVLGNPIPADRDRARENPPEDGDRTAATPRPAPPAKREPPREQSSKPPSSSGGSAQVCTGSVRMGRCSREGG